MNNTTDFDVKNIKYLKKMFGRRAIRVFLRVSNGGALSEEEMKTCERVKRCLTTMREFGENRWWLSGDKRLIAYYQFQTDTLIIPMDDFLSAVKSLLGRSVFSHEIWMDWEARKKEVERAFAGELYNEEEQEEAIAKSLERLDDLGKEAITVII